MSRLPSRIAAAPAPAIAAPPPAAAVATTEPTPAADPAPAAPAPSAPEPASGAAPTTASASPSPEPAPTLFAVRVLRAHEGYSPDDVVDLTPEEIAVAVEDGWADPAAAAVAYARSLKA